MVPKTSEDSPYFKQSPLKTVTKTDWISKGRRNNVLMRSATTFVSNKMASPSLKRNSSYQLTSQDIRRTHPSYKIVNQINERECFGEVFSTKYTAK